MTRRSQSRKNNCFKNNNHNYDVINTRLFNKENNLLIQYNKNSTKIEKRESSESEDNKDEIDVEKDATSGDDDEIIKDNHHFKNLYQS